ncbi:MAG: hypothetical protein ACXWCM_15470 [Acidimicrobiales bacterium]
MGARRFETFEGEICGFGTTSGHRIVIGRWTESPFGWFTDVMHEAQDGTRTLLAPTVEVAELVQGTYVFDLVRIVPVVADRSAGTLRVRAGDLSVLVTTGGRTAIGRALRTVPTSVARSRWWCTLIDPIARVAMRGVRTRGTAGNGRHEWYGATDQHRLTSVRAVLGEQDLGALADVWPPVRFGFSSTPRTPSIVAVTTTIREPAHEPAQEPAKRR